MNLNIIRRLVLAWENQKPAVVMVNLEFARGFPFDWP